MGFFKYLGINLIIGFLVLAIVCFFDNEKKEEAEKKQREEAEKRNTTSCNTCANCDLVDASGSIHCKYFSIRRPPQFCSCYKERSNEPDFTEKKEDRMNGHKIPKGYMLQIEDSVYAVSENGELWFSHEAGKK